MNIRYLTSIFSLSILLVSMVGYAQTNPDLIKVSPPSPMVQSIQRFADYPMNYSTGLPQISIPVYEIKSGSLTLPISFDYHASGCKVNPTMSLLGQDWTINAGGVLSRIMRDKPDGLWSFFTGSYNDVTSMNYISRNGLLQHTDKLYDIFSYNAGSQLSGKFFFQHSGTNGSILTPKQLLSSPTKISFVKPSSATDFTSFRIIADDGTIYEFGDVSGFGGRESRIGGSISAWWLAQIISADYVDTIKFKYEMYSPPTKPIYSEEVLLYDAYSGPGVVPSGLPFSTAPTAVHNISSTTSNFISYRLKEITFRMGKAVFNTQGIGAFLFLSELIIQDNQGNVVKRVAPQLSYFTRANNAVSEYIKVEKFSFKNNAGTSTVEEYSFDYYYNDNLGFPVTGNVGLSLISKDWWGYYNGNIQSLIPDDFVYVGNGGNRNPSESHAMQGMLRKIVYPSNGEIEFSYESNRYGTSPGTIGPGLRIKQQKLTNPITGKIEKRTYKYGFNDNGVGELRLTPSVENTAVKVLETGNGISINGGGISCAYRTTTFTSDFLPVLNDFVGAGVIYSKVTEYIGDESQNSGKTEYSYSPSIYVPLRINNLPSSDHAFPPYSGFDGVTFSGDNNAVTPMKVSPGLYYNHEIRGKVIYKNESGVYKRIKQTDYSYTVYNEESTTELILQKFVNLFSVPSSDIVYQHFMDNSIPVFLYDTQTFKSGALKITSETETTYDDNNSLVNNTTYTYDNLNHLYPTSIRTQASNGDIVLVKNKYPLDFNNLTATDDATKGIKLLQDRNIQNRLVESTFFFDKGGIVPMKSSLLYLSGTNAPYPQKIAKIENSELLNDFTPATVQGGAVVFDSRYKDQILFDRYNIFGKLLQQQKRGDAPQSYIWGYGWQLPTAEVVNASFDEIAYSGFEGYYSNYNDKWESPVGFELTDAIDVPTGKYCLSFHDLIGIISANVTLDPAKKYIFSCWERGAPIDEIYSNGISIISDQVIRTKGAWRLRQISFTGVTNYLDVIGGMSGDCYLDDVSVYPADAQMTSYTYDPLIGVTGVTNADGRIVKYEYDGFGRLKLIRDQDGNILKQYDYQYKAPITQ